MSTLKILIRKLNNFPKNSQDFQRARLINALLILMMATLLFFGSLDVFRFDLHNEAVTNYASFLLVLIAFAYFQVTKNIKVSATVTVLLITTITLFSIIQQELNYTIIIWMYGVPPVAFFLLGIKRGYLISIFFGICVEVYFLLWKYDGTAMADFLNVTVAYIVMVFFIANFERSREQVFKLLLIDIERRKLIENEIQKLNVDLEMKVLHRTRQLQDLNDKLNDEINIRKRAEEASNKARVEALEANRVKSEFLSRMSHKLRTPLNSILGFSQILGMSPLNEKQKKNLQHISNGGKELLKMVDDILEINNIDNIRLNPSQNRFSLNKVLMYAIEKQQQKINDKNITVRMNENQAPEINIKSDLQLLEKVFQNLLDNAIRYNRVHGEIIIQIERIVEKDKARDSFQVSFYDTGIGIPPEEQSRIFDIFLVAESGNKDGENTGLGLTMAKKIVEKLGGTIGVNSQLGIGSHFWIKLPVDVESEPLTNNINVLTLN